MSETEKLKPLNARQKFFCEEYVKCMNGTEAAIAAGYSKKNARTIASENLTKLNIRTYLDKRFSQLSMSKAEAVKLMSDLGHTALNEFFQIKKRSHTPKITKHLTEVIAEIKAEIEDAEKFMERAMITDKESVDRHEKEQKDRQKEIVRLQIQLERNPSASIITKGPEQLIDVAELDLVKMVKDKVRGRIKSITPTEFGHKIELYAADNAIRDMLKIHGAYEPEKLEIGGPDGKAFEITLNLK